MTLSGDINTLASRVAAECKSIRTLVNNNGASLTGLNTTAKTNLVAAINEVLALAQSGGTLATTTTAGVVELATLAETTTGTDATRAVTPAGLTSAISGKADTSALAPVALSGMADDLTGTLPSSVLPPLAINETFVVASQAAQVALTAERGDMAVRTDNGLTYVLSTDTPSVFANWVLITSAGAVSSVAGRTGAVTLAKADVGLSSVDNTSDSAKPVSTAQQTALNAKEASIAAGTTAQYWRGDKAWQTLNAAAVGLGNVDNTSDAAKPVSTATLTALNAKQALNSNLTAFGALTSAADRLPYATGANTWALATFTAFARSLLDDGDAATARTTLAVYSQSEIGSVTNDFVGTFNSALA